MTVGLALDFANKRAPQFGPKTANGDAATIRSTFVIFRLVGTVACALAITAMAIATKRRLAGKFVALGAALASAGE